MPEWVGLQSSPSCGLDGADRRWPTSVLSLLSSLRDASSSAYRVPVRCRERPWEEGPFGGWCTKAGNCSRRGHGENEPPPKHSADGGAKRRDNQGVLDDAMREPHENARDKNLTRRYPPRPRLADQQTP